MTGGEVALGLLDWLLVFILVVLPLLALLARAEYDRRRGSPRPRQPHDRGPW